MKRNFLKYKYGFSTDIESKTFEKGLSKDIIYQISKEKKEPKEILDFRMDAFEKFKKMNPPTWANLDFSPINFQNISYYSKPKKKESKKIEKTLEKLGISKKSKKNVAMDVVFDSVSIGVSLKEKLKSLGIILCPISEAIQKHFEIVKKYLGSVVPKNDNYYAALNSAVFSDGSFIFVPKGVKCPIELSTYFRINERKIGQFERTLIIAEENSSLSYIEGCTASAYDENQLHAAVVELVALESSEIKYSTIQNWYSGNPKTNKGGIYNFVTKRGVCKGKNSKISWSQVELGASLTWKYPSCILEGENSKGEFYSVALTNNQMQADTGTKMIHMGKNTRSIVISKGIAFDRSKNSYRGLVKMGKNAKNSRNFTLCDSLLVGNSSSSSAFPSIEARNISSKIEHEASISKMNEEEIFYLQSRGFSFEEAIRLIIGGFLKEVMKRIPLEFAVEAKEILSLKLERGIKRC
jgi:Fe-S cluster assembly protein SufB